MKPPSSHRPADGGDRRAAKPPARRYAITPSNAIILTTGIIAGYYLLAPVLSPTPPGRNAGDMVATPDGAADATIDRAGHAPRAECPTCGTRRPKNFHHPVFSRITVASQTYLGAVAQRGIAAEDLDELRAMIHSTDDADGGDIAVFAVRSAAQWATQAAPPEIARDALDLLLDAADDVRPRVRENARVCLAQLSERS